MSILQEYEEIRKTLTDREFKNINKFLERHPQYLLSDVYYEHKVFQEFEKWQNQYERTHLSYFIDGLSGSMFIRLSVEDLMNELIANPELKKYVLDYANSLEENPLSDKCKVIRAIENENVDSLYNSDTEVHESFAYCFLKGAKSMRKDLYEQSKQYKDNTKAR
ncbi:MAG: hypothetical protein ACLROI_10175 [Beduini sp.]|uniref:hypothetical protein n=1 Tax=Beduini sp. TaxID=1922300 RepID=UPI003990BF24